MRIFRTTLKGRRPRHPRPEGTVLMRSVDNEQAVRQPIKGGHDFRADARPYGNFVNRSPIDGMERLFSFRRLDPQDLNIVAGQTLGSTLARYYLQRRKTW